MSVVRGNSQYVFHAGQHGRLNSCSPARCARWRSRPTSACRPCRTCRRSRKPGCPASAYEFLVRADGAGRHAGGDHREDQQGCRRGAAGPGLAGSHGEAGRRGGRYVVAEAIRRDDQDAIPLATPRSSRTRGSARNSAKPRSDPIDCTPGRFAVRRLFGAFGRFGISLNHCVCGCFVLGY